MKGFSQDNLKDLNVVPDGKGGYRAMTREEKEARTIGEVKPKKKPKGAGFFHGMTMEDILQKYSGGPEGIYIPGNVASSKNGRGLMRVQSMPKPGIAVGTILPGPSTQTYKRETAPFWIKYAPVFRQMIAIKKPPYDIEFTFIRPRMNDFDFINLAQLPADLMKFHAWVPDDNTKIMKPHFADIEYDNKFPGVIIKVK